MSARIAALLAIGLAACASTKPELANISRMMQAPAREPGCKLEFVQASIMDLSPMGKYDILGYVNVRQLAIPNPMAEENRVIVRPKACELGGAYVSLMMSMANQSAVGDASTTVYAVLRDKSAAPTTPQPF